MAKKGKKSAKIKSKSSKRGNVVGSVHEAIPHPSSLPQWAIVLIVLLAAAVVVLALQNSLTGAFHIGKDDTVKSTDIGFYPGTIAITLDGRYQSFSVIRVSLSDRYGAAFRFNDAGTYRYTHQAYIVVKNQTRDSLLPGSVFYYHSGAWRWERTGAFYFDRLTRQYSFGSGGVSISPDPLFPADQQYRLQSISIHALLPPASTPYPQFLNMSVTESRGAELLNGSYEYSGVGHWLLSWYVGNFGVGVLPTSLGVYYYPSGESIRLVNVGYVSPIGSSYFSYDSTRRAPVIRYLYDTRPRGG